MYKKDMINNRNLLLSQIDKYFLVRKKFFKQLKNPSSGWINTTRRAYGMTLSQLAKRLNSTPQRILAAEQSEQRGSISLNNLRKVAEALEMELYYTLVPKQETLSKNLEAQALKQATKIVRRVSQNMQLEGQALSTTNEAQAIKRQAEQLLNGPPKQIWYDN